MVKVSICGVENVGSNPSARLATLKSSLVNFRPLVTTSQVSIMEPLESLV